MLTRFNGIKTTGRAGCQIEHAIPPTSTGAIASSRGARGGGLGPYGLVSELGARRATVLRKTGRAGTGKMARSVSRSRLPHCATDHFPKK